MNCRSRRCRTACFTLLVWFAASTAQAAVLSVEEFVQRKPEWEKLAQLGTEMKVEGRYSTISTNALRFRNCDLNFRAPEGQNFPRVGTRSRSVEVSGHLERVMDELIFVVEQIRATPDDVETYESRKAILPDDAVERWYELADWAAGRAEFYSDEVLAGRAAEANRHALEIEHQRLAASDADGRFALAEKATRLNLPETLSQELTHEAFHILWNNTQAGQPPTIDVLLERLAKELPGATVPLAAPQPDRSGEYWKDPQSVYRNAAPAERPTLHRIFYATVALHGLRARAAADGSNGLAIADAIDEKLPEFHDVAEEYRNREIEFRRARIAAATRPEALALAELLRKRGQPEIAREVLEKWLEARTLQARSEGPAGLLIVADYWRELLGDQNRALALLNEAYERSEQSDEVARKIEALGYERHRGEWVRRGDVEPEPQSAVEQAMREGRIIVGMTGEQVKKTLGPPVSVARVATTGRVHEIWTYGNPKSPTLAVHLHRSSRKGSTPLVVKIAP